MQNEDIEVRITKTGEIYVRIEGATEERLRDFKAFLEETIGPITGTIHIDRPDWSKPSELVEEEEQRRQREQRLEQ